MSETSDYLNPPAELMPLADALRSLTPAGSSISRDRLLFEAGRAAAESSWRTVWPALAIFFAGLSVLMAGFLIDGEQRPPVIVERERIFEIQVAVPHDPVVESPKPRLPSKIEDIPPADSGASPEANRMFQVRRDVLRWGPDMLPATQLSVSPTLRDTAGDLNHWLNIAAGTPNTLGDN